MSRITYEFFEGPRDGDMQCLESHISELRFPIWRSISEQFAELLDEEPRQCHVHVYMKAERIEVYRGEDGVLRTRKQIGFRYAGVH